MVNASLIKELGGLKRELSITVPGDRLENQISKNLQQLSQKVQIKGFRPGKIPMAEMKRRYGEEIRQRELIEILSEHFDSKVKDAGVVPAGAPDISPKIHEANPSLEYTFTFEIYPSINLKSLKGVKIEKLTSELSDEDLNEVLEGLRKQHKTWQEVDRKSKKGDQVLMDFDGTIDGVPLPGGSAKDFALELGSQSMIPGFEEGIIGMKPQEEGELNLKFPKDYHHKDIAGKAVVFKIKINKVQEGQLPELNDEFAKKLDVEEGLEALKNQIKARLDDEIKLRTQRQLAKEVQEQLLKVNEFEVPNALIEQEIERLHKLAHERPGIVGHDHESHEEFEAIARKNVSTGLLFLKVAEEFKLEPTPERIDAKIEELSKQFDNPQQIKLYYKANKELANKLRADVLEDMIVEKLLEDADIKVKSVKFDKFKELA